jgi:predicted Rossmann-fold nucleotide-binding protein
MKLDPYQHDLATPDGRIIACEKINAHIKHALVEIVGINPTFVGFELEKQFTFFNIKSTLAQLGIEGIGLDWELSREHNTAHVKVELKAIGPIGRELLELIDVGAYIGKLFTIDERRRVRDPDYLMRMFGRSDRWGRPLLSLGGMHGSDTLILDKVDGYTVAYLALKEGKIAYMPTIFGFLPTLARGQEKNHSMRELLKLHQEWVPRGPRNVSEDAMLLVKTAPLHIRTVFARVVDSLLPPGYHHTSASVLQPDTKASGDVYEFYGQSKREITDLPLEFYTLEPYREHVLYADRDVLQTLLENPESIFKAFATAPLPETLHASHFIVKGSQMEALEAKDWTLHEPHMQDLPGVTQTSRQAALVERFIQSSSLYPYLKAMEDGYITSQGVLLSRYFPSPLLKRLLLSEQVSHCLKGLYFEYPSSSHKNFFSQEDRALLCDLYKFAIPVYWVDHVTKKILVYTQKKERESGIFVPLNQVDTYLKATVFGVYGSNLIAGNFEKELKELLRGVLDLRVRMHHPLLQKDTPLALITGGGPGAMEVGNRIATELEILSCANIADFHQENGFMNEQRENPYIEAKMTYRLRQLVERQAEFNLDFPIFVQGGYGTDFELCLEEVRRKVGAIPPTPVLLFGTCDYWKDKITNRFQNNRKAGTIAGSEWVSNCFYAIEKASSGLAIYEKFFSGTLPIGKDAPISDIGFMPTT